MLPYHIIVLGTSFRQPRFFFPLVSTRPPRKACPTLPIVFMALGLLPVALLLRYSGMGHRRTSAQAWLVHAVVVLVAEHINADETQREFGEGMKHANPQTCPWRCCLALEGMQTRFRTRI